MTEAIDNFGLPSGRYQATVERVEVARNERDGAHYVDIICRVERNGKRVIESRKMGRADAYDLTDAQRKSLRALAKRIGAAQSSGPAEEVIASIRERQGATLTAHVRPNPMGGLAVTLYNHNGAATPAVSGEVIDRMPEHEPEYTERTRDAQGAHEQLLTGLHHANRGLAVAAQGAHKLRLTEGWTALGFDSLRQYLASPEIAMSRSQFYSLADIWEQYIEQGGLDDRRLVAPSKLEVPLAALKAGDVSPEEAIEDAETLGLRDLRVKYRGEQEPSGRPERPPSFPFACVHCGTMIESSEHIGEAHPE